MGAVFIELSPRYTGGSPAPVSDEELAQRVARQERDAYEHALEGVYGAEEKAKAEKLGLALIVFLMQETGKGWRIEDYITGDKLFWPFKAACPVCGKKGVEARRGILTSHYSPKTYIECCGSGAYVGRKRTDENP